MWNMESNVAPEAKKRIQSFTDLYAWQEGHKLVRMIYSATDKFPDTEKFGLIGQLRSASVSVTSNIAEGFRKKSRKEKQKFYRTALASLTEIESQILVARDVGFLAKKNYQEISEQSIRVSKLISSLIRGAPDKK